MIGKTITFDAASIRNDFSILKEEIRGKRLVYLDSAGSAQKPKQVIDAVKHVYEAEYSNVSSLWSIIVIALLSLEKTLPSLTSFKIK